MNIENCLKWSSEILTYPQTFGVLAMYDGFCCLGVAEELRGCKWQEVPHEAYWKNEEGSDLALSNLTMRWLGITSKQGDLTKEFQEWLGIWKWYDERTLSKINDDHTPFAEISRIIYNACVFEVLFGKKAIV